MSVVSVWCNSRLLLLVLVPAPKRIRAGHEEVVSVPELVFEISIPVQGVL